jgi:hypothetical protein
MYDLMCIANSSDCDFLSARLTGSIRLHQPQSMEIVFEGR